MILDIVFMIGKFTLSPRLKRLMYILTKVSMTGIWTLVDLYKAHIDTVINSFITWDYIDVFLGVDNFFRRYIYYNHIAPKYDLLDYFEKIQIFIENLPDVLHVTIDGVSVEKLLGIPVIIYPPYTYDKIFSIFYDIEWALKIKLDHIEYPASYLDTFKSHIDNKVFNVEFEWTDYND